VRVLVCGGRNYSDRAKVYAELDKLEVGLLIHGGATGADSLARDWAVSRDVPSKCYPALWRVHGAKAGPIRNQQMLVEGQPHLVVVFHGGRGTADMLSRSLHAGVRVHVVQVAA
jgi:hypothetical protein